MKADVFFLSYLESNREKNWLKLKNCYPRAKRVHGIKGLSLAHSLCAQLSQTEFFFVVNADNEICANFEFKIPEDELCRMKTSPSDKQSTDAKIKTAGDLKIYTEKKREKESSADLKPKVYCWRSLNPVNGLSYGFGGVKLFPKSLFLSHPSSFVDLSTSFQGRYQVIKELASITRFNASPLEAWRGAFRECAKLASACISNQKYEESKKRLKVWGLKGSEQAYGKYVLLGARQGRDYGLKNKSDTKALSKINDFEWLGRFFQKEISANSLSF